MRPSATSIPYAGRLAPSPTGLLHLGHARTFWTACERARASDGILWLRDEDLDRQRSREEFSLAMRKDLRWLGITWQSELRQSDRLPLYRAALDRLLAAGLAYPCTCSRRDLAQAIAAPHEDTDDEPVYNNRCRPLTQGSSIFDPNVNYRLRIPDGEPVLFDDLHAGPQRFVAGQDFGDFLVWRKSAWGKRVSATTQPGGAADEGLPSYQLACVVDDAAMHITEVVRGRDLLKSTARQMLLQRALGLPALQYFHCDLWRDAAGVRLAKRDDALALRSLREQGLTPEQVLAMF
jgi:glutamyl/glutaminyl-tRNA synthetase